jgi:hypothetical protein
MRTSFRHQSEAQPPNGPLTAAASPDTPSHMPSHAVFKPNGTSSHLASWQPLIVITSRRTPREPAWHHGAGTRIACGRVCETAGGCSEGLPRHLLYRGKSSGEDHALQVGGRKRGTEHRAQIALMRRCSPVAAEARSLADNNERCGAGCHKRRNPAGVRAGPVGHVAPL